VINKAPLIIKVADDAKFVTTPDVVGYSGVFGDGFVNGEGLTDLSGTLLITRTNAGVNAVNMVNNTVRPYTGVLVASGLTSNNYNITFAAGDYTIIPAQTLLIRVAPTNATYGDITNVTAPAYTYTAQYLPAATPQNQNPTPVSLTPASPVNGVYTLNDGAGGAASFKITAVNPLYSSTNRLIVGGYDMVESNVTVTGNNFLSMLTVGALTVAPKVISATNLGIANVTKVYDGNAAISGMLLNVNAASSQILSGDRVDVYATGTYNDANVGNAKSIVVDVSLSTPSNLTNDAANYSLSSTRVTGNLGAITQLNSVTYTGPSGGNWSNPSNWTTTGTNVTGAIPTFSHAANVPNVANVIIPTNANVVYDSASIGNSGSAIANSGIITFNGTNNFTFTDNVSGAGCMSLTGAGILTMAGNNTYTGGTNIHTSTLIIGSPNALPANVVTSSGGKLGLVNGITLASLTVNGDVTLVSDLRTTGEQIYNGKLGLGQSLTLSAGVVTFNDSVGKVMLSNQSGTYDYKTNDYYNIYTNLHSVNGVDIYSLTVLADSIYLNADVVTYGTQTYGSSTRLARVIIGDNGRNGTTRVLVSEDPAVTFWGTVDDALANTHDLIVKAVTYTGLETPTIVINGNVGSITPLKSLTTDVGSQDTVSVNVKFADIAVGSSGQGAVTINGTVTTAATIAQAAGNATAAQSNNGSGAGLFLKEINRNYDTLVGLKVAASVEVGEASLFDDQALCFDKDKRRTECTEQASAQ
jgi:autotransporter-associated beta strand protein